MAVLHIYDEAFAANALFTVSLRPAITAPGFSAPNIAVPATITFDPKQGVSQVQVNAKTIGDCELWGSTDLHVRRRR